MNIRLLEPNEIDVRVQTVKENGFSLLLYKDARVDMAILDETFGVFGWERKHEVIDGRLYCTIGIFDTEQGHWVYKQDVGTESYTEKEKGQASDSFKRAAFNIGIGRELYTGPFIWINNEGDVYDTGQKDKYNKPKYGVRGNFKVSEIGYNDNREIDRLVITDNKNKERYRLGAYKPQTNKSTTNNITKAARTTGMDHHRDSPDFTISTAQQQGGTVKFYCSDDGVEITEKVAKYSKDKYGRALCMACQNKVK